MKNALKTIANSLGIELPEDPPVWIEVYSPEENSLIDLACKIAGAANWSALLRIHLPVIFLLADSAERLGLRTKELEEASLDIFGFLSRKLRLSGKYAWPSQPRSPRYSFLASGLVSKDKRLVSQLDYNVISPTFRSIGFETIRGLIKIENLINKSSNKKSNLPDRCGLSARFLVEYSPNIANSSLERCIEDRSQAIEAYRARHQEVSIKRGYDLKRSMEEIENLRERFILRHLIALSILSSGNIRFNERRKPVMSRLQKAYSKHQKKINSGGDSQSGSVQAVTRDLTTTDIQGSMALGIAPDEFSSIMIEGKRLNERSGSLWARFNRALVIYSNEVATAWSRDIVNLKDLGRCYQRWFSNSWEKTKPSKKLSIFKAMMYLHYGLLPEMLTNIRIGTRRIARKLLKEDGLYLDKDRMTFNLLIPVQLEPDFLLGGDRWQDLCVVEVALHPLLQSMLKSLIHHYPFGKSGERWIPPNTKTTRALPTGITALKLCRAYEAYYVLRYGLEPELASLIAGRPVLGRNSSIHYFRSTHERLHQEHHDAFDKFHKEILKISGDPTISDHLPKPIKGETIFPTGNVGSPFCPSKKRLTSYLHDIRDRLENSLMMGNRRAWRDLLSLYTYECLRLVTGMRVVAEPDFHAFALMSHGNWLRLQEKGSHSRVVPVHDVVANLWGMLAEANNWQQQFKSRSNPSEDPLFYFIDKDGYHRPLSSHIIKEICQDNQIEHPDFKNNAHRHLMRSHIHECGMSYRIADFILGHLQGGPHPQDRLSLVPTEQRRRQFLRVADSLVKELNITAVRAWR